MLTSSNNSQFSILNSQFLRKGFSMLELMVAIGIIAVLMGAAVGGYSHMTKKAQQARGQELVSNVATALNLLFQKQGKWPSALMNEAGSGAGRLRARPAACLAVNKLLTLTYTKVEKDGESYYTLSGLDRFGIVSPWAQEAIKRAGQGGGTGLHVSTGGTVDDHVLYYALDTTGEGIVEANVGGVKVKVRGNAAVWCAGMDGKLEAYPYAGGGKGKRNIDDIYSWSPNQVER